MYFDSLASMRNNTRQFGEISILFFKLENPKSKNVFVLLIFLSVPSISISESHATNNASHLTSNSFARSQMNDQNDYSFSTIDGQFKQPMPPSLTNGSKRLPALLSATSRSLNFSKPQQTIFPRYSKFGEASELSNFKSIPDLYPINRSNANMSQSTSGSLLNGHEHSSMYSSSKYDSLSNSRPTQNNSNFLPTRKMFGTSNPYFNSTSAKSTGPKGNSFFTTVS